MMLGNREYDLVRKGTLEIDPIGPNRVDVFFIPPEHSLKDAGLDPQKARHFRTKLLEIDSEKVKVTIYPISTLGGKENFLKPKYAQVKRITLDSHFKDCLILPKTIDEVLGILEDLPPAFTKDYAYGLGLAKSYRFIIHAVEQLSNCTEIIITEAQPTGPSPNKKIFYISWEDFEHARLAMNNIGSLAQAAVREVRSVASYNIFAERMGLKPREPKLGRHPYRKLFTKIAHGKAELSEEDQRTIWRAMSNHATELVRKKKPERLARLRGDIELLALEALIQRYEDMLGKNLAESHWQEFFDTNSFILTMAFGYPVIKVHDQVSVGGRKLTGNGEKIADFLAKNILTNNTAIIEIKTPQTRLLNKTKYREGVFTPSADLSGPINQTLDQKYQLQKQISYIKENSRIYNIESYNIHCCLIIGMTPKGEDEQKSFELFRRNSKDVEIITFDELLEKLKQLADFLRAADKEVGE